MVAQCIRKLSLIQRHHAALRSCTRCSDVFGPVVVGEPIASKVLLLGQAPGRREPELGRPFAWTAGKQLFKWFAEIGLDEARFRQRIYMAAVCRCFPGKAPNGGGDRVPARHEVLNCRPWLEAELTLLEPELLILVGRLAIEQFLPARPLVEQVGQLHRINWQGRAIDVVPLPHPSGASTWPRTEPGKTLTLQALSLISMHAAFVGLRDRPARPR